MLGGTAGQATQWNNLEARTTCSLPSSVWLEDTKFDELISNRSDV